MKKLQSLPALLLIFLLLGSPFALSETVDVAMKDGVKLKTDVYLPQDGKPPFPVILIRSPYPRKSAESIASGYNKSGYAVVIQSVRGTDGSEGTFTGFLDDGWGAHRDGAETANWLIHQKWCNGKIGGWGYSAPANTQSLLSGATKDMSAQVIEAGATDFYLDLAYHGGVWRTEQTDTWLKMFGNDGEKARVVFRSHPDYDDFWKGLNAEERVRKINSPGLYVGSWYDIFREGSIRGFMARQYKGAPGAKGQQHLIMKPTAHGDFPKDLPFKFPANINDIKISQQRMKFFDYWLKGAHNGYNDEPRVWYYVIGDDSDPKAPGMEWRSAVKWPPFPQHLKPYHLIGETLSWDAPGENDLVRSYKYDPKNPCPTVGGGNLTIPAGPMDQRSFSSRPDVLAFTGSPLDAPMEVTGRVTLRLYVSTDAPDTDFTGKLVDIYPEKDGRQIIVADNIRRLKFRKNYSKPAPRLQPGEVVALDIDIGDISWVFNTGHRLGVQVSSSNFPRFEANPNTGDDYPKEGSSCVALNAVHMSTRYDSVLLLPVRQPDLDSDHDGISDEEEWNRGTYRAVRRPWHISGYCNTCVGS